MDQKYRWEQLYETFQSLPEDKRNQFLDAKEDDAEYQLFLSRILSELEMVKGEGVIDQSEASSHTKKSRPTKKMIPSAIKKTENKDIVGAVLRKLKDTDFIINCSLWALCAISAGGVVMFFKAIHDMGVMQSKATDKFNADDDEFKLDEMLLKVRDELREATGELKAVKAIIAGGQDDQSKSSDE